jgi:hypothetical protein
LERTPANRLNDQGCDRFEWAGGATHISVSWVPGVVGSPSRFYESLGFEPTGVVHHGEVEAKLDLGKLAN